MPPEDTLPAKSDKITVESTDNLTEEGAEAQPRYFGGLTAQEAGRRRQQKGRDRRDTTDADIETALRKKAATGDASAARELRAWMEARGEQQGELDLAALTREERRRLIVRLCEELGIEVPAQRHIPHGNAR